MSSPPEEVLRLREDVERILREVGEESPEAASALVRHVEEVSRENAGRPFAAEVVATRLLAESIRRTRFELKERVLELESLYDLGLSVSGTLDLDRLADEILLRSISLTNSRAGVLHIVEGGRVVLSRAFGGELLSPEAALRMALPENGVINNAASTLPVHGERVSGCEKCLVVPIQREGRHLGVLAVADKETREGVIADFEASDARLLSLFAAQAATALETARLHREAIEKERLAREIELAAAIQREILPQELPAVPGWDLAARTVPARQVGGDYFDVFPVSRGRFALLVADVSGKGVPAALLVSTLSSAIHLQVEESRTVTELVERVHRHLLRFSKARKFCTLFLARLDPETGLLEYVSAGHNPALLLRAGGACESLSASGVPVGMFSRSAWEQREIVLAPGDRLCVYSDGITEAQNRDEEDFGVERLTGVLRRTRSLSAGEALDAVLSGVQGFAAEVPQYDDQTVLLLSR